ncbi:DoxX family protein [Sinomicrobium weinanense]|uniref:DoxX family protein n=1 Tax=Sinomicrobium weinanense TaxID=2842200 RepID=A0A926JQT4_9FLAO|nr:DoxX family protein [Sinomicrobium weinanense]MBC9795661.1 DoxX family protein [Sinomicrobium weinanense]MBU3122830.1 DoxX family protein [Sinomicrobium weinanense]
MNTIKRKIFRTSGTIVPLVLRLGLGIVILPHGYQKITAFSPVMGHLTQDYGLPGIIAVTVILTEFLAPLFLLTGLASRIAAFLIGIVMLGAIPYHWGNGFFMNWFGNQAGEGFEFHLLAIAMVIGIVIEGGGKFALDRIVIREHRQND